LCCIPMAITIAQFIGKRHTNICCKYEKSMYALVLKDP
jgi:hypothetical protein